MKKINAYKKEIKITLALVSLFFLIAFSERKQQGVLCNDVLVEIDNEYQNYFLDETQIKNMTLHSGQVILGKNINRIHFREIEKKIELDRHVKKADLFGDLKGNLIVDVELRRPMARIIQKNGPDAYIAEDGTIMSCSDRFTSRVPLLSGKSLNLFLLQENLNASEQGTKIAELIRYIVEDDFWHAQVAQIDLDSKGKIRLYPQVSNQIIEFGYPDDVDKKFNKLKIVYKEILPKLGWNRYKRINLEFENQIIAE